MIEALEKTILALSPGWAASRAQHRQIVAYYEAARPTTARKQRRSTQAGDLEVRASAKSIREQARHLEENGSLANSILDTLVNYSVGPNGIGVEFQPRNKETGEIDTALAQELGMLRDEWNRRPEVTWQHGWGQAERMAARAMYRDGEIFSQMLLGKVPLLDHGTIVPFSLEFLEADFIPLERGYGKNSTSGIETNAWGRPVRYWCYKDHPQGENGTGEIKPVPANRMIHAKITRRFHTYRGMSVFAQIMGSIQDIKEAQEAEQLARKIAASMSAYEYTDGTESGSEYSEASNTPEKFQPGTIYKLRPGAKIGVIDTKRNSQELTGFIDDLKRDAAGGVGVGYSTISRKYMGTYSSQRQEMVESFTSYAGLSALTISQLSDPVNRAFVRMAVASGAITVPDHIDQMSVDDAMYILPQQPWIDPGKEMKAYETGERMGVISGSEIVRKRGLKPDDVRRQEIQWRKSWDGAPPMPGSQLPQTENTQDEA